jgi:hypothetical protein
MFEGAAIASDLLPNSQATDIAIFIKPRHPSSRSVGSIGIHCPPSIIPPSCDIGTLGELIRLELEGQEEPKSKKCG